MVWKSKKTVFFSLLIFAVFLFGCGIHSTNHLTKENTGKGSDPPQLHFPSSNKVKFIKLTTSFEQSRWVKNDPHDEKVMQKILGWLKESNIIGYTKDNPGMKAGPGTSKLELYLTDGSFFSIRLAYHCTESKRKTRCSPVKGDVDYSSSKVKHPVRLHSSKLNKWLLGGWKKDIPTKP